MIITINKQYKSNNYVVTNNDSNIRTATVYQNIIITIMCACVYALLVQSDIYHSKLDHNFSCKDIV